MCLSKECCFSFGSPPNGHWLSHVFWFQQKRLRLHSSHSSSHSLAFLALMSVRNSVSTHPHTARWRHWKYLYETPHYEVLLLVELALCRDHYIFTSCHCYHGKERKSSVYTTSTAAISLHCFHISRLPWRPAEWAWLHCASDMPEGATWCAFLPHYGFHSAVSEALNFSITDPLAWLSGGTCRGMCKHTERKVLQRREIPASGVCWESTLSEVLIAQCHRGVFLIAPSLTSSLLIRTFVKVLQ